MHTATRRRRLRPSLSCTLALALGLSFALAGNGQAQEPEEQKSIGDQITELVAVLDTERAELDELTKKIDVDADRATAVLMEKEISERRAEFRREVAELVDLVLSGEDAGAEVAQGRATATELLEAEAPKMKASLKEQDKTIITLVDTTQNGPAEEIADARRDLIEEIGTSTRLIKYYQANIEQRAKLGLDVQRDTTYLTERLQTRADVGAAMLKNSKEQIEELSSRPGADKDVEAQKQLATLRKGRDALAASQRVNVDLMDKYGLDTAQLRRGIIAATGKLSQDILDKDVAVGLVESSLADGREWLRSNGAELVFQAISFVLILLAFWLLARIARGAIRRLIDRSKLQVSSLAKDFFIKMTGRLVMLFGFIIAIAQLGVEVGPVLAGLGIAGFIVGLALQDTLSNFASGLMILVYRPFDVGDAIEAGGVTGKVDQMNLVSTMILTFDNQLLIVPNKQVWGGIIRNITHQDVRRVDMTFGIGYSDDIPKAEKVLADIIESHEKVLKDPEPVIRLHTLGESSVDFIVRPWSNTEDYWDVYWDITREVKRRFDEEGISIPFPQRDVHIFREAADADAKGGAAPQHSETSASQQTPVPGEDDEA